MKTNIACKPFRRTDLNNLPLREARLRFLNQLTTHAAILDRLFVAPLEIWISLSGEARDHCRSDGWAEVSSSKYRKLEDPELFAGHPDLEQEHRIQLEITPLCEALEQWAATFESKHNGEPAQWIMDIAVETLHQAGRRPTGKRPDRFFDLVGYSQQDPGEHNWIDYEKTDHHDDTFDICIKIPPKRPFESIKAFEKRFNKTCRIERQRYLKELSANWEARSPYIDFTWIDRFAQWQAGRSASEIDSSVKTPSSRAAFSRSIKHIADYLQLTTRKSKNDPKLRR